METAKEQLQKAALKVKTDKRLLEILFNHDRNIQVSLPLTKDNGDLEVYQGYRIQHNNLRGPYKGGLRYHQDVSDEEV